MRTTLVPNCLALLTVLAPAGRCSDTTAEESEMGTLEIEVVPLDDLSITIVYDNTAYHQGLRADWGFACVIEGLEKKILFDTGADGDLLLMNIDKLACHPRDMETVVLSHEHWDHVDGLDEFLTMNPGVEVFLLESFPEEIQRTVAGSGAASVEVTGPVEICTGIYSTGPMGSDPEEQSLVIATDHGAVVITGCAHPGITGIVRRAIELTGQDILLVMGGFHLRSHRDEQVQQIIGEFRDLGVVYAGPCHCTGDRQIEIISEAFQEQFIRIGVGRVVTAADLP
ncbi:MAG: MBL fold metallo-hydrolase [Candidatus Fermentibacteraceae bacterium]|nr:MBL fold metallo-hydrolase [Candidatus Fermentibacteraceae bacterium]